MKHEPQRPDKHAHPAATDLTDAEWDIMRVVWEKEPCAAGDVQEKLEKTRGWAYSTVKTVMDRMVAKGLLTTRSVRHVKLFSSSISKREARAGAFKRFVRKAFGGAVGPMMEFLVESEELSEQELEELRKTIARSRKKRSGEE